MAQRPAEFNPNFKIPVNPNQQCASTAMSSILEMPYVGTSYDPNMGPHQAPMVSMWPYPYPRMMPPVMTPTTPTVISAPPALNANGIKRKIDKDMISELHDSSLPKELTSQFQPLYCKLCSMHLNSSSNAKLHYQSKNHQKKVRKFLIEYSEKTGEPLHKKANIVAKKDEQEDPKYTYCSVCDLQLTSKLHAEQHYMGKNHQRAASKSRPPAGSGYYDENGVWHRIEKPPVDTTGRQGIGLAFAKPEEYQTVENKTKSKFYCDLCKVSTTSAEHLQMHISGQKHQKLLRKTGGSVPISSDPFEDLEAIIKNETTIPEDNILTSVIRNEPEKRDYSVFRTPSGWYYCQPCNLTLNSEVQFVQHLDSKKHLKKKSSQK